MAKSMKLRGFVRNLSDSTVEVLLEGPEPDVDAMIHKLRTGPRSAKVDDVKVTRGDATGAFPDFLIERE